MHLSEIWKPLVLLLCALLAPVSVSGVLADETPTDDVLPSVSSRFAPKNVDEVPSFQRHVLPMMGRLGCNGRACHGSFQGKGGFRLSLFGYDFDADHKALLGGGDSPRVDPDDPSNSLILYKPTDADEHEGGQRFKPGGWEYHVFRRWIEAGAKNDGHQVGTLERLEIIPAEVVFKSEKDTVQLRAIAHWSDGAREDVTPICRFQTNDDAVATIDVDGVVACTGAGDTHVVVFYDNGITPVPVMLPISPATAKNYPKVATRTKIDELVVAKLKKLGVVPSEVCDDAEFLRRASLDITATLPAPEEVEAFLADKSPNKRAEKIDELLARPGYSAWWATKFGDWTGNNAQNIGNNSFRNEDSRQWYQWLRYRIEKNVPYDEMMAGIVLATSRQEGQSYEEYCREMGQYYRDDNPVSFAEHHSLPQYWERRNIRQPEEKALSFSYAFMGVRIQCAQCHKHPFDQWSKQDFEQFTAFFGGITYGTRREDREATAEMNKKLGLEGKKGGELRKMYPKLLSEGKTVPFQELYVADRPYQKRNKDKSKRRVAGRVITPKLLGGDEVIAKEYGDPRVALMEWLHSEDNPYFAKALVNRVWANYFHRGIIEPADDLNLANPPSNAPLLDWLTAEFIAHDYDMKWLHRTIVLSDAYQRSWVPNETNRRDEKNFARAVPRRLPAEVIYDALKMATASDERRAEMLGDVDKRSIGPSSSYQGRGRTDYALTTFGKPARVENCDCERSLDPSLLQVLYVRNDAETLAMIDQRGSWLDQIAREKNLRFSPSAAPTRLNDKTRRQLADAFRQVKRLSEQIEKLQADGKKEQAQRLIQQRQKLRQRIARVRGEDSAPRGEATGGGAEAEKSLVDTEGPALIRQAYLRTLSRHPDERELSRAVEYLRNSKTVADGLRDMMWALINTKEFMVNH